MTSVEHQDRKEAKDNNYGKRKSGKMSEDGFTVVEDKNTKEHGQSNGVSKKDQRTKEAKDDIKHTIEILMSKVETVEKFAKQSYQDLYGVIESKFENAKKAIVPLKEPIYGRIDNIISYFYNSNKSDFLKSLNYYHLLARAWLINVKDDKIMEELANAKHLSEEASKRIFGTFEKFETFVKKEFSSAKHEWDDERHHNIVKMFFEDAQFYWKQVLEHKKAQLSGREKTDALRKAVARNINKISANNPSLIFYETFQKLEEVAEREGEKVNLQKYIEEMKDKLSLLWNDDPMKIDEASELFHTFSTIDVPDLLHTFTIKLREGVRFLRRYRKHLITLVNTYGSWVLDLYEYLITQIESTNKDKKSDNSTTSKKQKSEEILKRFNELNYRIGSATINYGQKGVEYVQTTRSYKYADSYINFGEKFSLLKNKTLTASQYIHDKVYIPISNSVLVLVDKSGNYVSIFIKTTSEKGEQLLDYVHKHQKNVKMMLHSQWIRLDYDNDENVSVEDIKKTGIDIYAKLKEMNYLDEGKKIYRRAIEYVAASGKVQEKKKRE